MPTPIEELDLAKAEFDALLAEFRAKERDWNEYAQKANTRLIQLQGAHEALKKLIE